MTSAATPWRSPLAILLGARRNDDDDLELRGDYFQSSSVVGAAAVPKPPAVEPASRASSYNPFGYFRPTPPAAAAAATADAVDAPDADADDRSNMNMASDSSANGKENGLSPVPPPLGAFPPLIMNSPENAWYQPNDQPATIIPTVTARKSVLTWSDRKAIIGTIFNFTNSIIGAGAMGLGGAFTASGGGISVLCLIGGAFLTKASLDLIVDLSSCPYVILVARPLPPPEDENSPSESEAASEPSETLSEELELNELMRLTVGKLEEEILALDHVDGAVDGSNIDGIDQTNQADSPSTNDSTKHVEDVAGDETWQKAAGNDVSPLMANAQEQGDKDRVGDAVQTPTNTGGLNIDHPLQLPDLPKERDRYDSLAMNAILSHFSPLLLSTDGAPFINSTPPLQNDSSFRPPFHVPMSPCTYEELGQAAYGTTGRLAVLVSKALYSCGCLIAYIVVVRDNFGPSFRRIVIGPPSSRNGNHGWLQEDDFMAFLVSAAFVLPLCMPRTMTPLAKVSFISILSTLFMIIAVVYLYFSCSTPDGSVTDSASLYENWIEIRSFSALGCFVFPFVGQHTVHLAYESLPSPIRNPTVWRRVSTNSTALALQSSLAIGVFTYLTFGSQTPADALSGYPADLALANVTRLLWCLIMILTFPLPFLTCREMIILICVDMHTIYHTYELHRFNLLLPICEMCIQLCRRKPNRQVIHTGGDGDMNVMEYTEPRTLFQRWGWNRSGFVTSNIVEPSEELFDQTNSAAGQVTESLLSDVEHEPILIGGQLGKKINPSPLSSKSGDWSLSETTVSAVIVPAPTWIIPDGNGRQLSCFWHAALTFTIWLVATMCAIQSSPLGGVLDLVGAFIGTLLAFVLPSIFSFKLKGYSHLSSAILLVGGGGGLLGTVFSFTEFTKDVS